MRAIRVNSAVAIPVLLLAGTFILCATYYSMPLFFLRTSGWTLLVFLGILLAAFGPGALALRLLLRNGASRVSSQEIALRPLVVPTRFPALEEAILIMALGLGLLGTLLFPIVLLRGLRVWVMGPLMGGFVFWGIVEFRNYAERNFLLVLGARSKRGQRLAWQLKPVWRKAVPILLGIPLTLSFFMALAPVCQSDALRYHMSVPAWYVWNGGYMKLPDNAFSAFPFMIQTLYSVTLLFRAESAARLIHWFYFLLVTGAVYCAGKRIYSKHLGTLCALVFATTPFFPFVGSWAYVEMGLSLYVFLTFYSLLRSITQYEGKGREELVFPPNPGNRHYLEMSPESWVILSGLCMGFAFGIKYTALFSFVFALGFQGFRFSRNEGIRRRLARVRFLNRNRNASEREKIEERPIPRPARIILIFGVCCALAGFPWYLKNLVEYGNPVYPFGGSVFPTPYWSEYNTRFYHFVAGQKGHLNEIGEKEPGTILWDLVTLPYQLTTGRKLEADVYYALSLRPERILPWHIERDVRGGLAPFLAGGDRNRLRHVGFGGFEVGPLWILLLILLVAVKNRPREVWLYLLWGGLHFLVWAYTYRDNRFLLPTLALLAIPAGYSLLAFTQKFQGIFVFYRYFFLGCLAWNVATILSMTFNSYNPVGYLTDPGPEARVKFLETQRDTRETIRAMEKANQLREPGEPLLLIGDYKTYPLRPPYIASDWFNAPVIVRYAREADTVDHLVERLRMEGVRYVMINFREIEKYEFYFRPFFLPEEERFEWLDSLRVNRNPLARPWRWERSLQLYSEFIRPGGPLEPVYTEPQDKKGERPDIGIYRIRSGPTEIEDIRPEEGP